MAVCVGGVAHAAPRWCKDFRSSERVDPEQVKQALDDYGGRPQTAQFIVKAATYACSAGGDEHKILAAWQKESGLDEAGAVASLAARVSPGWTTDHEQLCKQLPVPDGSHTDDGARNDAIQHMFACDTDEDIEAAWMVRARRMPDVGPLLDRGVLDREHDEITRLAWVMGEVGAILEPQASKLALAQYAVIQFDTKALSYDAIVKQLDAPPYRGNRYAKAVILEAFAHTKAQIATLEAEVAARTKDPAWRDAIVTAPQQAASEWRGAAARHKDIFGHGCAALPADVVSLIKPIAATTANIEDIEAKLREDPIAGLIIWRWAHCLGEQGDSEITNNAAAFSQRVPPVPGPRAAAYHAALASAAGRKRPIFDFHDIDEPGPMHWGEEGLDGPNRMSVGIIKTMATKKTGTALTFVPEKFRYMSRACRDTNKIDWIDNTGHVHYRQECHDAGMAVGDHAPGPTTILAGCTAGLAKGRLVWLNSETAWLVYADKSARKLVAAYCLPLQ